MPRPCTHLTARRSCPRPALARGQVRAIVMDELAAAPAVALHGPRAQAARAGQPLDQGRMTWPLREGKAAPLGDLGKGPRAVGRREMPSLKTKWLG